MPTGTEGSAVDSLTSALVASMDVVEAEWKAVLSFSSLKSADWNGCSGALAAGI